jgi:hypothetical protein
MQKVTDYPRQRESRRLQGIYLMGPFVLFLGIACSLALSGPGRVAILVSTVAIVLVFVVSMARPVHPSALTQVTRRGQPGNWPASFRAHSIPGVLQRLPRIGPFAEFSGRLAFTESAVVWEPTMQTQRSFGVGTQSWDGSWSLQARRLRGLGNQVQVTLTKPGEKSVTLWMRHGRGFEIT